MVGRRVGAGDDGHVGVDDVAVGGGDRAGADALEQRGHAGGVAQPGAVVHVVGVEARPDQLLEEVGLLVGALRRPEPGDRAGPSVGVDLGQAAGDQVERLLPGRLPEVRQYLVVIDQAAGLAAAALAALALAPALAVALALAIAGAVDAAAAAELPALGAFLQVVLVPAVAHVAAHLGGQRALRVGLLAADQRHGQPLRRGGVVPAVTALDAQPALGAGLVAALGERDRAPLPVHVVGERAADAAVRAHGVDLVELAAWPDRDVPDRLVGQRAGRARRDALATGHARGLPHRVVQVERDPGGVALAAAADDVVALDVVTGPHAAVAQDARVVVHGDDRIGEVRAAAGAERQAVLAAHPVAVGQREQLVVAGGGLLGVAPALRLVGQQQLGQHGAAALDLAGGGLDLHAVLARADAGGGVGGRADVDHAHPADADRVETLVVAQDRDVDSGLFGRRPDGRALGDGDLTAVDRERHRPGGGLHGNGHVFSIRPAARSQQLKAGVSIASRHSPAGGRPGRPGRGGPGRRARAPRNKRRSSNAAAAASAWPFSRS